jgi:hypothetical protein
MNHATNTSFENTSGLRTAIFRSVLLAVLAGVTALAHAASFHVATTGSPQGNGSRQRPWSLALPLYHPPVIKPGDTIWVQGGRYVGHFESWLRGTAQRPIVVRAVPGARVIVETPAGDPNVALFIGGDYAWFWGIEFASANMDTNTVNAATVFVGGRDPGRPARGNRLINCILRDGTGNGLGDQTDAVGTQVIGCLIFHNGRKTDNRNYAYAIYGQNGGARKTYAENIVFHNFGGYAFHLYTESGTVDSIDVRHNIIFGTPGFSANVLFSEASGAAGIRLDSNYFYGAGPELTLYQERKAMLAPLIRGNYFMNGRLSLRATTVGRVMTGNRFYGNPPIVTASLGPDQTLDVRTVPGNTWFLAGTGTPRPGGVEVIVRRNPYEAKRAHVVVYNWDHRDKVSVDLSGVLSRGDRYEVRDAQNFFGAPLVAGRYDGSPVAIPMNSSATMAPASFPARRGRPEHTSKEFGAFVLLPAP